MEFSNFIVAAATRCSQTVLERMRVLGMKILLSTKSEDGDSRHRIWRPSLLAGGGTNISGAVIAVSTDAQRGARMDEG